jgi:hypothetical protein
MVSTSAGRVMKSDRELRRECRAVLLDRHRRRTATEKSQYEQQRAQNMGRRGGHSGISLVDRPDLPAERALDEAAGSRRSAPSPRLRADRLVTACPGRRVRRQARPRARSVPPPRRSRRRTGAVRPRARPHRPRRDETGAIAQQLVAAVIGECRWVRERRHRFSSSACEAVMTLRS